MDFVNSQQLRTRDGYYHLFTTAGDYVWGIGNVGAYVIHVVNPASPVGNGNPTIIKLSMDPNSGMYVPDATTISIHPNDFVLWHLESSDPQAPPFTIVGNLAKATSHAPLFRSTSLQNDDAYSHQFWAPGTYSYVISGGSAPSQQGSVVVTSSTPPSNRLPKAWNVDIDTVTVNPKSPNPPITPPSNAGDLVYPGDTVYWDIVNSAGCSLRVPT